MQSLQLAAAYELGQKQEVTSHPNDDDDGDGDGDGDGSVNGDDDDDDLYSPMPKLQLKLGCDM